MLDKDEGKIRHGDDDAREADKWEKQQQQQRYKEERTRALAKQRMEDKLGRVEKSGNNELLAKSKASHFMRRLNSKAG